MSKANIEYKGNVLGKNICVVDVNIHCSKKAMIAEYQKHDKYLLLRHFIEDSDLVFHSKSRDVKKYEIILTTDFLNYCSITAIKYGIKKNQNEITSKDLIQLLHMSYYWYQKDIYPNSDPNTIMMIISYRQFPYHENYMDVARNIFIYTKLWKQYKEKIDIQEVIKKHYGLTYKKFIFYCFLLLSRAKVYFYKKDYINDEGKSAFEDINGHDFNSFINIVALDEKGFIDYKGSLNDPTQKYPILKTQFIPEGQNEITYLILSRCCLMNKMTYGIYYDMLEKYKKSNGENLFKTIYGNVFQEYVGILLKEHFKKWQVIPEIQYKKKNNFIASVDWFLKRGKALLLIEVKQSALYAGAKYKGNIEEVKKGIEQNILKAIKQLNNTEQDILSYSFKELSNFHSIREIQKLIVVGDAFYNGNLIVNELYDNLLNKSYIQIINISELEMILSWQDRSEKLFYLLRDKSRSNYSNYDFKEYLLKRGIKRKNN